MKPLRKSDLASKPQWVRNQLNRQFAGKRRASKMHNQRAVGAAHYPELAGRSFQSKIERDRAEELCLLLRGKQIRNLKFQPRVCFDLGTVKRHYKPDFYYEERLAPRRFSPVWEEVKGFESDRYKLNKRLWRTMGPGLLRVVKRGRDKRLRVWEEIRPKE